MTVHIREKINETTGITSLTLEIYKGYSRGADGAIKAKRTRKKLDLFYYTKPKNSLQKNHNKETKRKVEAYKGRVYDELVNKKYNFSTNNNSKVNFLEYYKKLTEDRRDSKGNHGNWYSALKHLEKFTGVNTTLEDIDVDFCERFKTYLEKEALTSAGKPLSTATCSSYFCKLRAALNAAVDDELIIKNPALRVSLPRIKENKREFLTEEEVRLLYATDCRYPVLKNAFLFSCFTGLRWSDVQKLKWTDLRKDGGKLMIPFHQQKTDNLQYHPISSDAQRFLPEKVEGNNRIFIGLNYSSYMNVALSRWVLKAGITKNITFHCSRHTFATLLLTKGIDLFTVSKLLGHKEIRTTQIYANVIDSKKEEAVDSLNIL